MARSNSFRSILPRGTSARRKENDGEQGVYCSFSRLSTPKVECAIIPSYHVRSSRWVSSETRLTAMHRQSSVGASIPVLKCVRSIGGRKNTMLLIDRVFFVNADNQKGKKMPCENSELGKERPLGPKSSVLGSRAEAIRTCMTSS